MAMQLSFHATTALSATCHRGMKSSWVDITLTDTRGKTTELSIFFEDHILASRLTQAINQAQEAHR